MANNIPNCWDVRPAPGITCGEYPDNERSFRRMITLSDKEAKDALTSYVIINPGVAENLITNLGLGAKRIAELELEVRELKEQLSNADNYKEAWLTLRAELDSIRGKYLL